MREDHSRIWPEAMENARPSKFRLRVQYRCTVQLNANFKQSQNQSTISQRFLTLKVAFLEEAKNGLNWSINLHYGNIKWPFFASSKNATLSLNAYISANIL